MTGFTSQQDLVSAAGEFSTFQFMISQAVARLSTIKLVKVVKVTNTGGDSAVGFVDVQPLVNLVDGALQGTPHSTLTNVPYFRIQGGANAIILDPQVNDIGLAAFADRDISTVKRTKAQANPASYRMMDWGDGLYFGGFLNGVPSQYVAFSTAGISIVSPTAIALQAPDIKLTAPTVEITASTSITAQTPTMTVNGNLVINGTISQGAGGGGGAASLIGPLTVTNDVTAGSVSLKTHHHTGVTTGSGNTGGPV